MCRCDVSPWNFCPSYRFVRRFATIFILRFLSYLILILICPVMMNCSDSVVLPRTRIRGVGNGAGVKKTHSRKRKILENILKRVSTRRESRKHRAVPSSFSDEPARWDTRVRRPRFELARKFSNFKYQFSKRNFVSLPLRPSVRRLPV